MIGVSIGSAAIRGVDVEPADVVTNLNQKGLD